MMASATEYVRLLNLFRESVMQELPVSDWFVQPDQKREIGTIITELSEQLKLMGFDSFVYQGAPLRMRFDMQAPQSQQLFKFKHLARCSTAIFSNREEKRVLKSYYNNYAAIDTNFTQSTKLQRPFIHSFSRSKGSDLTTVSDYFSCHGINSILNWPVMIASNRHWVGLFRMNSDMKSSEIQKYLPQIQHRIYSLILMIHTELQQDYYQTFNPFLHTNAINTKAINIVNLVARGVRRNEIAELLSISPRGVDYHIEQLSMKLRVNNRLELICICKELGLIDNEFKSLEVI
ncbi:helix-turn-helix transcriptional regulator [Vibrio sp. MACH09]|uniref:response regulator transcription factor n=1 Tax=Vibrio sp. MACH09 TaxID=3025122 RepID=UPI002791A417|nr:LuxR C-terminal-related transcriptional regulator [Vibrio sp. MACH09]GLO62410.1 helix-turn-helix transcriptional regulator [Vibrio sp. MACH09]